MYILLLIQIYAFDCFCQERLTRDFSVILVINDHDVDLEAYHSKENKEIIKAKNPQEYRNLRWLSIGYPIIVESESKIEKTKSLFHFTSKLFYASIQITLIRFGSLLQRQVQRLAGSPSLPPSPPCPPPNCAPWAYGAR